jgi:hypothetical protein
MVFCHDINGFMKRMKEEYNPSDGRLSIDSSQGSLKAVFRKGNAKPFHSDRPLCITESNL